MIDAILFFYVIVCVIANQTTADHLPNKMCFVMNLESYNAVSIMLMCDFYFSEDRRPNKL